MGRNQKRGLAMMWSMRNFLRCQRMFGQRGRCRRRKHRSVLPHRITVFIGASHTHTVWGNEYCLRWPLFLTILYLVPDPLSKFSIIRITLRFLIYLLRSVFWIPSPLVSISFSPLFPSTYLILQDDTFDTFPLQWLVGQQKRFYFRWQVKFNKKLYVILVV
jgi:hypothetical protein